MKNLVAILALLFIPLLTACPSNPDDTEYYYEFSAPDEMDPLTEIALDKINEQAGCSLVGKVEEAPFVNPIVVVEDHEAGPQVIGCAFLGEALARKEHPRDIEIVRRALYKNYNVTVIMHEVGHSIGLPHIPVEEEGVMHPVASSIQTFHPTSLALLHQLCEEEMGQANPDDLMIDLDE